MLARFYNAGPNLSRLVHRVVNQFGVRSWTWIRRSHVIRAAGRDL